MNWKSPASQTVEHALALIEGSRAPVRGAPVYEAEFVEDSRSSKGAQDCACVVPMISTQCGNANRMRTPYSRPGRPVPLWLFNDCADPKILPTDEYAMIDFGAGESYLAECERYAGASPPIASDTYASPGPKLLTIFSPTTQPILIAGLLIETSAPSLGAAGLVTVTGAGRLNTPEGLAEAEAQATTAFTSGAATLDVLSTGKVAKVIMIPWRLVNGRYYPSPLRLGPTGGASTATANFTAAPDGSNVTLIGITPTLPEFSQLRDFYRGMK